MEPNIDPVKTFKELMDWIMYDWDYRYSLKKDSVGNFYVNKLYITKTHLTYKTECAELEQGLFEKLEKLWELLDEH